MSKKKIAAITVGGLLGISMIGNAIDPSHDSKATATAPTFTQPANTVDHIRDDVTKAITGTGDKIAKLQPKPAFAR